MKKDKNAIMSKKSKNEIAVRVDPEIIEVEVEEVSELQGFFLEVNSIKTIRLAPKSSITWEELEELEQSYKQTEEYEHQ